MLDTLLWWLIAESIGLVVLPIAYATFGSLADRGYAVSKTLGLLLVGYVLWITGVLHLLPNSRGSILLILLLLAVVSLFVYGRRRNEMNAFLRTHRSLIVATELVFAVSLVGMALLRAYTPEILGTEKPMDFAFLNAVLRSPYFPPPDPWLSGFSISYYYFGHIIFGAVIKLSGTPAAVGYNLCLALIYSLAASSVFGLVCGLVWDARGRAESEVHSGAGRTARVSIFFGIVGVCLVLVIGNLEAVLELMRAHGWGSVDVWQWFSIRDLVGPKLSSTWYPNEPWWWWRATRVIGTLAEGPASDYTITEFPFFSFLLGDLHPHVMALPFGVLALAFGYNLTRSTDSWCVASLTSRADVTAWVERNAWQILVLSVSLGAFLFLNTWDFPTYFVVVAVCLLIAIQRARGRRLLDPSTIVDGLPAIVAVGVLSVVLYAPFLLSFQSQASGLVALRQVKTWPVHFGLVMGFLAVVSASFLLGRFATSLRAGSVDRVRFAWSGLVALIPFALWLVLIARSDAVAQGSGSSDKLGRLIQVSPALVAIAAGIFLLDRRQRKLGAATANMARPDAFAVLSLTIGFLLLALCELVFIKDVFGNRMNTVFKLYYQAWLLLAIASAYGLYWVGSRLKTAHTGPRLAGVGWYALIIVLGLASLVYPAASAFGKTNGFAAPPTLDGLAYARAGNPDELDATTWLANNAPEGAVVVESTGGQYSEYGRVSARTGIPTLLGWAGHERQWRGTDRDFVGRDREIDTIYNSSDLAAIKAILQQRKVTYVFVGQLERAKYGEGVIARLASMMDVAFRKGGTTVFKVR